MSVVFKNIKNILLISTICLCQTASAETALEAMGLAYIKEHQALEALGPTATSAQKAALHKEIYSNALKLAGKELGEKQAEFGKKAKNLSKDFADAMKQLHPKDKKDLADKKDKSSDVVKPEAPTKRAPASKVSARASKPSDPVEAAGAERVKFNVPAGAKSNQAVDAAGAAGVKFNTPTGFAPSVKADDAVGAENVKFNK